MCFLFGDGHMFLVMGGFVVLTVAPQHASLLARFGTRGLLLHLLLRLLDLPKTVRAGKGGQHTVGTFSTKKMFCDPRFDTRSCLLPFVPFVRNNQPPISEMTPKSQFTSR